MVKELTVTNLSTSIPIYQNGLFYDGTRYWKISSIDGFAALQYATTITGEWTLSGIAIASLDVEYSITWLLDGTTLYVGFGDSTKHYVGALNISTLALISNYTYATNLLPIKLFKLGASLYCQVYDYTAAKYGIWDLNVTFTYDTGFYHYGQGYVESSVYYFEATDDATPDADGTFKVRSYNGAAFAAVASYDLTAAVRVNRFDQLLKIGTSLVRATEGYLFIKKATMSIFDETKTGTNFPIIGYYWNSGVLTVRYIYFLNDIIKPINNDYAKFRSQTTLIGYTYAAWDSYFIVYYNSGYTSYEFSLSSTTNLKSIQIRSYIERGSEARIETILEPIEDQSIEIYDDSSNLLIQGTLNYSEDESDVYFVSRIRSFISIDLDKKIDYTGAGLETIAAAFANIITANFDYGSAGTLTSSATTYSFSFEAKPIREIFSEMAHLDGKIWYCSPDDKIYLDAGTEDSGIDVLAAAGTYCGIDKKTFLSKIGTVELWGKDGAYYKKSTNTSNQYYSDVYPSFGQTQIEALATSILTVNATKIIQYTLTDITGLTVPQVGKQITLEQNYDPELIASAQYYTKEIWYDAMTTILLKMIVHDALHYPMSQMGLTNEKVEAHVIALETKVDAMAAPGGTIDNTAYDASWSGVTTIGPSKNAVYNKIETLALKATTLTGSGAIAIDTDQSAHDLSANRTISLENDAGNNITHIETSIVTDSPVKIPASAAVYDALATKLNKDGLVTQDLLLKDNEASALDIKEGSNSYIKIATTDGSELITVGKNTTFTGTLTQTANQAISDNAIITADAADIADNDYAKFTANGVEGRSYSEAKTDLEITNGIIIQGSNTASTNWKSSYDLATGTSGTPSVISIENFSDPPPTYEVVASISGLYKGLTKTHTYPIHFVFGTISHRIYYTGAGNITSGWYLVKNLSTYNNILLWLSNVEGGNTFFVDANGTLRFYYSSGHTDLMSISTDVWYHLCIEIRNSILNVYVNGIMVYTTNYIYTRNTNTNFLISDETLDVYLDALYVGNSIDEAMSSLWAGGLSLSTKDEVYITSPVQLNQNPITNVSYYESIIPTGTAPLTVASTTKVTNLNSDQVDGADLETTWTDSDTKISSSKAMGTKASALISTHASNASAHHAKYTDGEAVAAMGVKGDANPLNHDKYVHPNHSGDVTSVADGATSIVNKQTATISAPIYSTQTISVIAAATPTINLKNDATTAITSFSTDGTLGGNSDTDIPTEKAVKTYVTSALSALPATHNPVTLDAAPNPLSLSTQLLQFKNDAATKITSVSTDGTLAGNSDTDIPTEKAVKTYADTKTTLTAVKADADIASAISLKHAAVTIDGTSPLSLSTQAISLKNNAVSPASVTAIDIDGTLASNSDTLLSTQKAIKTYADTKTTLTAVKADADITSAISLKHAAATVAAGQTTIAISTQELSIKNDAGNVITEIDTAATLEDTDLKIPTSKRVKAAIDLKANIADPTFTTKATAPYFVSSVAVGTQPFQCTSTTKNTNLNADQVDGADLETTWTDSDTKISSSKAMATKASALISTHAGVNNAHHNPASVAGSQTALTISTQELALKNDAGSPAVITTIEQGSISNSAVKIPTSSLVYAVKATADAAMPSANLESTPTNGATTKAPNSDWAYKIESEAYTKSGALTLNENLNFADTKGISATYDAIINAATGHKVLVQINGADKLDIDGTDIDCKSQKLVNVTDPTAAQDAATKNYVDPKIKPILMDVHGSAGVHYSYSGGSEWFSWKFYVPKSGTYDIQFDFAWATNQATNVTTTRVGIGHFAENEAFAYNISGYPTTVTLPAGNAYVQKRASFASHALNADDTVIIYWERNGASGANIEILGCHLE